MRRLLIVILTTLSIALAAGQKWAIVVAGSSGYLNYRHQADALHAYHMLKEHDFDRSHVITMIYDDIANNVQNPYKGNVINRPRGCVCR